MTLATPFVPPAPRFLSPRRAFATNAPLTVMVALSLLGGVAAVIGLLVDPAVITGVPAWVKPLKFYISTAIYSATFLWLLGFVQGRPRLVAVVAWVTTLGFIAEHAGITVQVLRGTTSHFNVSTPFNAALYGMMGAVIVTVWLADLLLAVLLLRQRIPNTALAWGLRLGVLLAAFGMGLAYLMTTPLLPQTPAAMQIAAARGGAALSAVGGHTVGVADGGPGLPFVGWSTVAGDLRIAHFVGLHGLQVLPLVAFAIIRFLPRLGARRQTALVLIAGAAYLGLDLLLAWQALRGQSIVRPDALTLGAAAGLVVAVTVAVAAVLARSRRVAPIDGSGGVA